MGVVSSEAVEEEEGEGEEGGGSGDEDDNAGREAHQVKEALKEKVSKIYEREREIHTHWRW